VASIIGCRFVPRKHGVSLDATRATGHGAQNEEQASRQSNQRHSCHLFAQLELYTVNGPAQPEPAPGVCTLMGALTQKLQSSLAAAAKNEDGKASYSDEYALPLQKAVQFLRKAGFTCTLPPKDHNCEHDYRTEEEKKEYQQDPELGYLRSNYYKKIPVQKDNETVVNLNFKCDWLCVTCANDKTADLIDDGFKGNFALGRVFHEEKSVPIRDDLEVLVRTGGGAKHNVGVETTSPSSLFQLMKGNKVIAKCLCSYSNRGMEKSGPTIELFEMAQEWQQHGYAAELLEVVEGYVQEIFYVVDPHKLVNFNVCYVTNHEAYEWFLSKGFDDCDGMGEELGKLLFH